MQLSFLSGLLASSVLLRVDGLGRAGSRQGRLLSNQRKQAPANKWDLGAAMRDEPAGAYLALISPLSQAVMIAHWATYGPWYNESALKATIGVIDGKTKDWERVFDLDMNPTLQETGPHALTFVNHREKRAILAIRGSCLESGIRSCDADACVLLKARTFGAASPLMFGPAVTQEGALAKRCAKYNFSEKELDYYAMTDDLVTRIQERFPGYAIITTGHSMGGHLAMVAAARRPSEVQAFTFAPSPFHTVLEERFHFTDKQTQRLPEKDIVAICDPYDCGINTMLVPDARAGTMTCVYDKWVDEPSPCHGVDDLVKDQRLTAFETPQALACKGQAHDWSRYAGYFEGEILANTTPAFLPSCNEELSTLSSRLIGAMHDLA